MIHRNKYGDENQKMARIGNYGKSLREWLKLGRMVREVTFNLEITWRQSSGIWNLKRVGGEKE